MGGEGNTPEEALQVRAEKLREQLTKAKEANDSGKIRRYTRLVQVSLCGAVHSLICSSRIVS